MTKKYILKAPSSMIFAAIGFLLAGITIWLTISNFYDILIPLHIPLSLVLGGIGSIWFQHVRKTNPADKWIIRYLPHLAFTLYTLWFLIIHIDIVLTVKNLIFVPIIVQIATFLLLGSATRYVINFIRWRSSSDAQPKIELSEEKLSIDYPWEGETLLLDLGKITHIEVREFGPRGIWMEYQGNSISISENWLTEEDYKNLTDALSHKLEVGVARM